MAETVIPPEDVATLAAAPKKTVGDEGSVEERSMDEYIKAAKFLASNAANAPPFGMRIARIRHGGTVPCR